ncbi:MAG TPA: hypothetical protein VN132_10060 [Bdellovibrio sp.]|nr:hypothetical protein [Bdellovibrio sp.]
MECLRNSRGQGLIESLLCLPLVILAVSFIFLLCYRAVVFYYADFQLHEALICVDEKSSAHCENELKKSLKKILLARADCEAVVRRQDHTVRGFLKIHFPLLEYFGSPLMIEKQLTFPLKTESSWKLF